MCDYCDTTQLAHTHDPVLVILSVVIAIFASYVALDLANSVSLAKGRARLAWLMGGSLAMGVGIWSMHFVGMLAFKLPKIQIAYDVYLIILSVVVAVVASAIALFTVSRTRVSSLAYVFSSLSMGGAIAGMHYIGIASMRMPAIYNWNKFLVAVSIAIAVIASFVALQLAVRFREDVSIRGFWKRAAGGIVMGFAIAGMHYTGMAAMHFFPSVPFPFDESHVLASEGLAVAVIGTTLLILCIALAGSVVDRALARRSAMTEQITRILESITDAFYSVNRNWEFTYINRVAREVFEKYASKTADLLGANLWQMVPDLLDTKFEDEARSAMSTQDPSHFELSFGSTRRWLEVHVYPSSEGLSVYFQDITVRKQNEQALREAIRSRDEFLSIASHELKTPLTSLKLQAQVRTRLLQKGEAKLFDAAKLSKIFEDDNRQIDRLARLVEDMLDISRISTGRLTIQMERFDLCALLNEIVERYGPHIEQAGCTLTMDNCTEAFGNWDRFRIEQVIINLLTNAVRYGKGQAIHINVKRGAHSVIFSVRDEGMGIAKENFERIFQRFERAVSSAEVSGLGLGLYIARQIVEMHGGSMRVESELGKGATFFVELPL